MLYIRCQKCGYEPKGTGPQVKRILVILNEDLDGKTFQLCEPCIVRVKAALPPGA